MNWDEYFINIAEQVKLKSKDKNTQIGVVIVGKDNSIVSTGYNSFPRGIDDNIDERQEKPEKYFWFEHAERNAIYNAARIGVSTLGTTLESKEDVKLSLTGLWFRINDKVQRLKQLVVLGQPDEVGESIQDTYEDLSVYGIIAQIVQRGKWSK